MSVMQSVGRAVGSSAAYAWEGSKLASTQFAQGAKAGYAETSAALIAKRAALMANEPVVRAQRKVAVAKA